MNKILFTLFILFSLGMLARTADAQSDKPSGYKHGELLVGTNWIAAHSTDPDVRVVDMRDEKAYTAGHIPSAVRIEEGPLRNPEERFTYLPRPETFATLMEQVGIGNRTHVIVYDDQGGKMAARLWYVMNAFGHSRISLVNGGWNKWLAEKRAVSFTTPIVARTHFTVKVTPEMTCALPQLLGRKRDVVVLDARSPDEYDGETTSPNAAKAGRIPGAVNVEWKENVAGPNLEFKPADQLRKLYTAKGVTPNKEIVVHCASGGRAAQSLFTLKLLGYPKVKVYYGSFSDYSTLPDAPVEK